MKTAIGSLKLALALLTIPAVAAEGLRLVPPKEYDHSYAGELFVLRARDQDNLREMCPAAPFRNIVGAIACSRMLAPGACQVVILPDDELNRLGFPPDVIMRHEIAHCNGWPGDHPGALPIEEWVDEFPIAPKKDLKGCWLVPFDEDCKRANLPKTPAMQPSALQQPASRPCGIAIQKPCE